MDFYVRSLALELFFKPLAGLRVAVNEEGLFGVGLENELKEVFSVSVAGEVVFVDVAFERDFR